MRLFPKLNTIYYRLIFSYLILIIITTFMVGAAAYYYFASNFNQEIVKVNSSKIDNLRQITEESIFLKAKQLYADLTINEFDDQDLHQLFNSKAVDKNAKINGVFQSLRNLVSLKADYVESIDVYFKDSQMIISSAAGVKYLNQENSKQWVQFNWFQKADSMTTSTLWLSSFPPSQDVINGRVGDITLLGSYPYISTGSEAKGIIAIHLKATGILDLIKSNGTSETGTILLVNELGELLGNSGERVPSSLVNAALYESTKSNLKSDHFITSQSGKQYMVNYTTLDSTGWKLLDFTSISDFYKKSDAVLRTLMWVCAFSIMVGLLLSNIFTWNIYNPLKRVLETAKTLFTDPSKTQAVEPGNEYALINQVINHLSIKVQDLESTLQNNKPLIKNQLVLGLLNRTIVNEKELTERLQLLRLPPPSKYYVCVLFEMDEEVKKRLDTENSQFVIYSLIEQIEHLNPSERLCLAIPVTEDKIATILSGDSLSADGLKAWIQEILSFSKSNFIMELRVSMGNVVESPLELHLSYKTAEDQYKYGYVLPDCSFLTYEKLDLREKSTLQMADTLLLSFQKALKQHDQDELDRTVRAFFAELKQGTYSMTHVHQQINELVTSYRDFVKSLNRSSQELLTGPLLQEFVRIRHVDQLQDWLILAISETIKNLQPDAQNRMQLVIEEVKRYIADHIGDELSLQAVAETVMLNPSYLSKIFKEGTGINFVDYVNSQRVQAAKELILKSDANIEEISRKVGFNSSTYFIKKFKETFGVTPKNYKIQHRLSQERE